MPPPRPALRRKPRPRPGLRRGSSAPASTGRPATSAHRRPRRPGSRLRRRRGGSGGPGQVQVQCQASQLAPARGDPAARRLHEPLHDCQADAGPGARPARRPRHPVELLEQPGHRGRGHARAGILDRQPHNLLVGQRRGGHPDPGSGRRVLEGVLERVGHGRIEEDRVGLHRRCLEGNVNRAAREARPEPLDRAPDEVLQLEDVRLGPQGSRLDPAQVQHVGDQPVEVLDLPIDRIGALALSLLVQVAAGPERSRGGADGGERRAQVMRHGLEQRRLDGVALAGNLRRLGSRRQRVERHGLAHLVGGRGEQPRLGAVGLPVRPVAKGPDRPEHASAGLDPHAVCLERRCRPAPRGRRLVDADPSGGDVVRQALQDLVQARGRPPDPSRTSRPTTRSRASSGPSATQTRAIAVSAARVRAIVGSTSRVEDRVASSRLTRNSAIASRSRSRAWSARERWSAASWPTTIPVNRSSTRLSHSPGSETVKVRSGWMNRKS